MKITILKKMSKILKKNKRKEIKFTESNLFFFRYYYYYLPYGSIHIGCFRILRMNIRRFEFQKENEFFFLLYFFNL